MIIQRLFSKKALLKDVESDKGIGRAIILSPFDKGGGLVGGYVSKKEAGKMLKKGGKIAIATGGVVAAGIGAKKLADKKKAKKEEKK